MTLSQGRFMKNQISEVEFLQRYNIHEFDIPLTSVDMSIFTVVDSQLKVLLVKRAQHPAAGKWALPGGFIDLSRDETLEATAARKLVEKTGVTTSHLEQVQSFGSAIRDPRGWSVTIAYMALIATENITLKIDESSDEIAWVPLDDIVQHKNIAFDHKHIIQICYQRLKNKVEYTSLAINLLPKEFTLTELQTSFEIILGCLIEKKSFRKRLLDANIVAETGEFRLGSNRPAKLYCAKPIGKDHYFPRSLKANK